MRQTQLIFLRGMLLLIMTGILNAASAQDYHSFPDSNAIWSEIFTSEQPFEIDTYQYGISGDTMINSNWYKKIYLLNDTTYPLNTGEFCGAIREDDQKRIFVIECSCTYPGVDENEVLLYDFSKTTGDTIYVGEDGVGPWGGPLVINHIDSVLINNEYRKTFHFSDYLHFWIEGVGSTRGLFSPISWQTTGYQEWELICFNENNEVRYLNPDYNSCFPLITGIEEHNNNTGEVHIHPNPVTDVSVIDFQTTKSTGYQFLELYNVTGQKIFQRDIKNNKKIYIHAANHEPGLYLFHIKGKGTLLHTGKIIIK